MQVLLARANPDRQLRQVVGFRHVRQGGWQVVHVCPMELMPLFSQDMDVVVEREYCLV